MLSDWGRNRSNGVGYSNEEYGLRSIQEKFLMLQIKKKLCVQRKDYSQRKKTMDGEDKHR